MRLSNELFARALDWIFANTKVKDQKTLAAYTGITGTTISRILNDRVKQPSEDTIRKLNAAFGDIFNPAYFRGENINLLIKDSIDAKMYAQNEKSDSIIDESSLVNAALSAQMSEIATLKHTIADMKEQHQRELADKDALIAKSEKLAEERLHRIAELRRFIDSHNLGLPDFPFPVGAAEQKQKQKHL